MTTKMFKVLLLLACLATLGTNVLTGQWLSTTNAKRIQGIPVCADAPADTNVLVYVAASGCWKPGAGGGAVSLAPGDNIDLVEAGGTTTIGVTGTIAIEKGGTGQSTVRGLARYFNHPGTGAFQIADHFLKLNGELGWTTAQGTGATNTAQVVSGVLGVHRLATGTTNATNARMFLGTSSTSAGVAPNGSAFTWEVRVRLLHITLVTAIVGFGESWANANLANGVGITLDPALSGNFRFRGTVGGSTHTYKDCGVALDTAWHVFTLDSDGTNTTAYLDGVACGTAFATGNWPASLMLPGFIVQNGEAADKHLEVDWFVFVPR